MRIHLMIEITGILRQRLNLTVVRIHYPDDLIIRELLFYLLQDLIEKRISVILIKAYDCIEPDRLLFLVKIESVSSSYTLTWISRTS